MIFSKHVRAFLVTLLAHTAFGLSPVSGATIIKLGTLAPEGSGWVNSLRAIDAEIREVSGGEVGFKIYPGGVQGDEHVMLRKIRIGQIHGGGFGGTGVSRILPDVLALEMPFLFDSYEEVDYVLAEMDEFFTAGFAEAGYEFLGWSDIGFVYLLSQQPIRSSTDIQGMDVWRLEDEPITEVLFRLADVTSVPLTIPDVLFGLQTNLVEVVYASAAAAIVLQWFTRVRFYTDLPINYTVGAVLVHNKAFHRIPNADHRDALRAIARKHINAFNRNNRDDNREALKVMRSQAVQPVTPRPEDVESFRVLVERAIPELVGSAFSAQAYDSVLRHLDDFRRGNTSP
ncbi:MAG: TRAP transporter substrate-binding protein DctP [Candidatus Latescibacterota bacterium]|nr:TRAP transporter substrate-binding protein DctP [Candidatus Latescibacterota bacterium]